jgi:hypothetical protein
VEKVGGLCCLQTGNQRGVTKEQDVRRVARLTVAKKKSARLGPGMEGRNKRM